MRGVISAVAQDGTYGQIALDDGQRFSYWTSEVRNGPAAVGQAVEFQMWEGQPVEIFLANNPRPPSAPPPRPAQTAYAARPTPGYAGVAQDQGARIQAGAQQAFDQLTSGSLPAAYWIALFTSPSGRISRLQFWLHGVLPLIVASIVLGWIPIIGQILTLAFFWCGICLAFKRFHDLGYPGWYSLFYLVPMLAAVVILGLGMMMTSILGLAWLLAEVLWGIGMLVGLAQLIFVYVRVGEPGPNRFGPDPLGG